MKEKEVKIKYKKVNIKIDFDKTLDMHDKFIKEFAERVDFVYFQQNKDKFVKLITDLREENQSLKDRWQKLKEWIDKELQKDIKRSDLKHESFVICEQFVLDKMQELEREEKCEN